MSCDTVFVKNEGKYIIGINTTYNSHTLHGYDRVIGRHAPKSLCSVRRTACTTGVAPVHARVAATKLNYGASSGTLVAVVVCWCSFFPLCSSEERRIDVLYSGTICTDIKTS